MAEQQRGHRCKVCVFCRRCFNETPDQEDEPKGSKARMSSFAVLKRGDGADELDATTGATPGVSSACSEFGLDDMQAVLKARGIKPPGVL